MNGQEKASFCFGPFRLDVAERLLLRDGEAIQLPPKAFETLLVLVENSGRLVTKKELIDRLWPDAFVEEANLANNISLLRKVLDDDRQDSKYIKTVTKSGYRFVAAVTAPGVLPDTPTALNIEQAADSSTTAPRIAKRWLAVTLAGLVLVFGAG